MKVRALVRLRNAKMLSARDELGISQRELASLAEVPYVSVQRLEALNFSVKNDLEYAPKIASFLCLSTEDVLPASARGHRVFSNFSVDREVAVDRLLAMRERLTLPSPEQEVEAKEISANAIASVRHALSLLPPRDQDIFASVYGLAEHPLSVKELGRKYGLCHASIRQIANVLCGRLSCCKEVVEAGKAVGLEYNMPERGCLPWPPPVHAGRKALPLETPVEGRSARST